MYSGGGYISQLELHLQRAEALLSQYQQNVHKTQQRQSLQVQTQHYARVVRHAKVLRLQFGLENGDVLSLEMMDGLAEELEANKKAREDIILLAWLKRIRSSLTYTPPQVATQDAKDSFSLIVSILPEYQPSTSAVPSASIWSESNISRWQLVRHFLAGVESVIQNLEQAGKPQEAYVVYSRALSVALRAGAIAYPPRTNQSKGSRLNALITTLRHIGRICLGMGELEYYRHHWSQAKKLLRRACSAFRGCATLHPQEAQQSSQLASNLLVNKRFLSHCITSYIN